MIRKLSMLTLAAALVGALGTTVAAIAPRLAGASEDDKSLVGKTITKLDLKDIVGKTWTLLDKRLPYCSAVAWAKDRWIAVGSAGSHASLDNGVTWKQLDEENYNSVAFTARGAGWAVGPKGRVSLWKEPHTK